MWFNLGASAALWGAATSPLFAPALTSPAQFDLIKLDCTHSLLLAHVPLSRVHKGL